MNKICTKCKRELPATNEYFGNHKIGKYGLRSVCLECRKLESIENREQKRLYNQQYYQNNKEQIKQDNKRYKEANADYYKEYGRRYSKENREKLNEYGRKSYEKNKLKVNAKNRKHYQENKHEYLERQKRYRENNQDKVKAKNKRYYSSEAGRLNSRATVQRRRAKKRGLLHFFTPEQWELCQEHFGRSCAYCGDNKELEQDHFVPVQAGGEYLASNIIPACGKCNRSKGSKPFHEWYHAQEFYSSSREKAVLKYLGVRKDGTQQVALVL